MTKLKIEQLRKSFSGLKVLQGVSFDVEDGSITGLIGPNGSGKSTLFNCVSGILPIDGGKISFMGTDISNLPTYQINKLGLSRTFQDTRLFPELTVLENLMLPPKHQSGENPLNLFLKPFQVKKEENNLLEEALEILNLLEIEHMAYEYSKNLSGGQSKLVDLGRVLMSKPSMLLLDEPTAGVNPILTEKLFQKILELRRTYDLTILLIEHDMDVMMKDEVDKIFVLSNGNIVAEGSPAEIQKNQEVIEAYLGQ